MTDDLFPYLPKDEIIAAFERSPGNEIRSGKFSSEKSSAALAANTFGLFINRPRDLPSPALMKSALLLFSVTFFIRNPPVVHRQKHFFERKSAIRGGVFNTRGHFGINFTFDQPVIF